MRRPQPRPGSEPPRSGRRRPAWLLLGLAAVSCQYTAVVGEPLVSGTPLPVRLSRMARADVLLVIDSSASMAGKQDRLGAALGAAAPLIAALGSVHLGVVTTDLGAGTAASAGCRPDGDDATLRAVGAAAGAGCHGVSDGAAYLSIDFTTGASNLAGGTVGDALSCLLQVGADGCAFEQPLEAAWRALSRRAPGGVAAGDGFLRDDAVLVVIFVTDEDDCSTLSPGDLFNPQATATWGPLTSFRCARAGLRWGLPPMPLPSQPTGGPLPMGAAYDGPQGPLAPIDRYRALFAQGSLGGLKADPNDVVLAAFSGPREPLEVIAVAPSLEPTAAQPACDGPLDGVRCAAALRHGCVASSDVTASGDPAPRLSLLVESVARHYLASICETDHRQALADLVALVQAREAGDGCLAAALANPQDPACSVTDVVTRNGASTSTPLPACDPGADNPPCWRIVDDAACAPAIDPRSGASATRRLEVVRRVVPESGTATTATCTTA